MAEANRKAWLVAKRRTYIPRMIHCVWIDLGKGPVPPEPYLAAAEKTKKIHKKFDVLIWTIDDLLKLVDAHYGEAICLSFETYKNGIYNIDAAKILILYRYGGYYGDFDLAFSTNVETLFQNERDYVDNVPFSDESPEAYDVKRSKDKYGFIVRLGNSNLFLNNFFMGFTPAHLFLSIAVIRLSIRPHDSLLNSRDSVIGVMEIAGPMFVTRCYNEYKTREAEFPKMHLEVSNRIKCVREKGWIAKSPLIDPFEAKTGDRNIEFGERAIAKHFSDATWLKHNMKHIYADALRVTLVLIAGVVVTTVVTLSLRKVSRLAVLTSRPCLSNVKKTD